MAVKLRDPRIYGASPITQPSSANQAAVATTVITTGATSTTPFGYTETVANNLTAIVTSTRTLVNQLRADLVTLGLIKGSA